MTENRSSGSLDPWMEFLDAEGTYKWLLAEARWEAELFRDAFDPNRDMPLPWETQNV